VESYPGQLCEVPQTNDSKETGKAANNKKLYMFYHQLQFLLPHVRGNSSTSSNISASAGTQNDAEGSQDTLDQTANSTAEDSQIVNDATASPTTGTSVPLSLSKRKRTNLDKHGSKRAANEQSIALSAKESTSILTESLAIQK
jgi:hypothetical protein